jgi:hypothetical protein
MSYPVLAGIVLLLLSFGMSLLLFFGSRSVEEDQSTVDSEFEARRESNGATSQSVTISPGTTQSVTIAE